jgi:Spy/CpxP family protein refolding chaperone
MEIVMKRVTGIALAVGLALGVGTAAVVVAQPHGMTGGGGMGMMGGGMGMMSGGMGMMGGGMGMMGSANIEDRLAAQKSALKITPEQEPAWGAYADVAKKEFEAMRVQHEAMAGSAPASSAERYELHSKLMQERAAGHESLSKAYKDLYAVLTPEQRVLADQRGGHGHHGPAARAR